jgi:hypothetical protein
VVIVLAPALLKLLAAVVLLTHLVLLDYILTTATAPLALLALNVLLDKHSLVYPRSFSQAPTKLFVMPAR